MPVIILERIPLPSLQTYTAFSVVLLSCALFYSHQIVSNVDSENVGVPGSFGIGIKSQPRRPDDMSPGLILPGDPNMDTNGENKRADTTKEGVEGVSSPLDPFYQKSKGDNSQVSGIDDAQTTTGDKIEVDTLVDEFDVHVNYTLPFENYVGNMIYVMTVEIWCVWTLINMAFCCLILLGKVIQKVVFGELRVSELQHLKDKFWNFVFYKFIFVFGVMNVQTMEEVVLWVVWFTMLGFFNLLAQLCKDRFEYLSFSPTTPKLVHIKLLSLLFCILLACSGLMLVCVLVGLQAGITIFSFMTAECLLLGIRLLYVVIRYAIHLWDLNLEGVWENRSSMIYYTELLFELACLSIDFAHHLHMLLWGNIFLSMASLVICMQLRYLFHEFQRRIKRHKNYLRVVHNMESRFTMGTTDDLEKNNDDCAICWERMEVARKLPCGHLFHNSCLRSWLEQDTSCPTCRMSLNERPEGDPNGNNIDERGDAPNNMAPPPPGNAATTNHFFHFDGSRYVSWLPSFSVEVTHTQLYPGRQGEPNLAQTSQLDNMARQVQDVFPHMPLSAIMQDLHTTFSVDHTIDNILVGRLHPPTQTGTFPGRSPTDREGSEGESATPTDVDRQLMLPPSLSRTESETERRSDDLYEPMTFDLHTGREEGATPSRSITNVLEQSQQIDDEQSSHRSQGRADFPSITGTRFSKSPLERETMLQDRKNALIEQARKKFLSTEQRRLTRPGTSLDRFAEEDSTASWSGEDRNDPRELAFQAAQRRLQQQQLH